MRGADWDPTAVCARAGFHQDSTRWFVPDVLGEIGILREWMASDDIQVRRWKRVLMTALSSLLHGRLSVVRNYHYTYVVDRSRVTEECREPTDVERTFTDKLQTLFVDAELLREQIMRAGVPFQAGRRPELVNARAQDLARLFGGQADLVITSPPYFGMNDYVRSQYLSWLVFQWDGYENDLRNESGSRRHRKKANALDAYYSDMKESFSGIYHVLRRGGRLALVVGSSEGKFMNGSDPLSRFRELVLAQGFCLEWTGQRRVRFRKINNTPYRTEVLWVLLKP